MTPLLWSKVGRTRRYALTAYMVFGMCVILSWMTLQIETIQHGVLGTGALTPAAKVFFAGFGLLMFLVVTATFTVTIAVEDTLIQWELRVYERIRAERNDRDEALRREFAEIAQIRKGLSNDASHTES